MNIKRNVFVWGTLALASFLILLFPHFSFSAGCVTGQVDINTASATELDQLVGVGPATAQNIIDERPYSIVDDLVKASGIGDVKLQDIKNQGLACVASGTEPDPEPDPDPSTGTSTSTGPTPDPGTSTSTSPTPGPEPAPSPTISSASAGDVLISEVAWMGSAVSANAEWIELYSTTGGQINLEGWTINSADGSPSIHITATASSSLLTIDPGNFFLLERTSDNSVPGVSADFIYTGILSNTGESLVLGDGAGNQIDFVKASGGWPAGDNSTKQTMQLSSSGVWVTADSSPRDTNNSPPPKPIQEETSNKEQEASNEDENVEEDIDEKQEEESQTPPPPPKLLVNASPSQVFSVSPKDSIETSEDSDQTEEDKDLLARIVLSSGEDDPGKKGEASAWWVIGSVLLVLVAGLLWLIRKGEPKPIKTKSS